MKWTRTMNLRYALIAMRFVIGLMTLMTVVAAIAMWRQGESMTAVLKGVLVSAYVCLTFGLGWRWQKVTSNRPLRLLQPRSPLHAHAHPYVGAFCRGCNF